MDITVNGQKLNKIHIKTIPELLKYMNLSGKPIAVEYNGKVLSSAGYNDVELKDGDKIEIVTFVGGG
jgi:sulfur carrier protein